MDTERNAKVSADFEVKVTVNNIIASNPLLLDVFRHNLGNVTILQAILEVIISSSTMGGTLLGIYLGPQYSYSRSELGEVVNKQLEIIREAKYVRKN